MKELIAHTEYLVHQYNCVVIPGLGGFVLNHEPAYINKRGLFVPPKIKLGFNSELKHNDGLLANSYVKRYAISYDAACHKINQAVKELLKELALANVVSLGRLGAFRLQENRIVFEPNLNTMRYPSTWGLTEVALRQLNSKSFAVSEKESKAAARKKSIRKVLITIGSAAAVIVLMFTPVSKSSSLFKKVQQSGYFDVGNTIESAKKITQNNAGESEAGNLSVFAGQKAQQTLYNRMPFENEEQETVSEPADTVIVQPVVPDEKKPVEAFKPHRTYYVIIGGDTKKALADKLLLSAKNKGFKDANLISAPDRHRIYVASFDDKKEANTYLDKFRKEHPAYKDAWLLSKKN